MYLKKALFRPTREPGTGLRAMATLVVEAHVELVFATDIRIPGIRVIQGAHYYRIEFPEGLRIESEQWRNFFEGEVLHRYAQWIESKRDNQQPFANAA